MKCKHIIPYHSDACSLVEDITENLAMDSTRSVLLMLEYGKFTQSSKEANFELLDAAVLQACEHTSSVRCQHILKWAQKLQADEKNYQAVFFYLVAFYCYKNHSVTSSKDVTDMVDCMRGVTFTIQGARHKRKRQVSQTRRPPPPNINEWDDWVRSREELATESQPEDFSDELIKHMLSLYADFLTVIDTVSGTETDVKIIERARCLNNIGILHGILKQAVKALLYRVDALSVLEEHFKMSACHHQIYGHLLYNIALLYMDAALRRHDLAIDFFQRAKQAYASVTNYEKPSDRAENLQCCQANLNRLRLMAFYYSNLQRR